MNPVNLLDFKSKRGSRSELVKQLKSLSWTESLVTDFVARVKAHTTILARSDMKINFANDVWYFNAAMEAALDYEIVRQHPEVVVDFLQRGHPQYRREIPQVLLMKDEWLNHKNTSIWLRELFRDPTGADAYLKAALSKKPSDNVLEKAKRFRTAYSVMENVGMNSNTVDLLIGLLGYLGEEAYDVLADEMKELTYTKPFLKLMATLDPDRTRNVHMFLAWYAKQEADRAGIFEQTLNMPGTKQKDFWRYSEVEEKYGLAETEYNAHRAQTSASRHRFMGINLRKTQSQLSTVGQGKGLSCSRVFATGS